jgi:1-acyl-sn-glycerol-3-phosphate acyltransferase
VLGFPEGTTSDGSCLLPFRRGLFGVARLAGVPVIPIALAYDDPDAPWVGDRWLIPHYLATAARSATRVAVAIGAPLWPTGESAETLAHVARTRIQRMLRGLHLRSIPLGAATRSARLRSSYVREEVHP